MPRNPAATPIPGAGGVKRARLHPRMDARRERLQPLEPRWSDGLTARAVPD